MFKWTLVNLRGLLFCPESFHSRLRVNTTESRSAAGGCPLSSACWACLPSLCALKSPLSRLMTAVRATRRLFDELRKSPTTPLKKQHVSGGAGLPRTPPPNVMSVQTTPQHKSLQTGSIMPPSFLFGVRRTLARVALPSRKTATEQRMSICQSGKASIGGCDSAPLVGTKFLTIFPVNSSTWTTQNPLRLMPLGGSITHGVGSSDQNGYRKILLDLLRDDGFNVLMVGSRTAGTMSNDNHEGWRGFRIDQIERRAVPSAEKLKPHLFTVNAGSNDCLQDY